MGLGEQLGRPVAVRTAGPADQDAQRHQPLLHAVGQVTFDAAALLADRRHHGCPGDRQLLHPAAQPLGPVRFEEAPRQRPLERRDPARSWGPRSVPSSVPWCCTGSAPGSGGTVFLGRMVPVFRSFVSLPAGVERMPLLPFLVLTALGSLVWNSALVLAGYSLGQNWWRVEAYVGSFQQVVVVVVLAAVAWFVTARVRRNRRTRA